MPMTEFKPFLARIGNPVLFTEEDIKSEPMVYGGSWEWTRNNSGPITNQIMDTIYHDVFAYSKEMARLGYHPVIDTKKVLLMPGQYPCIPGWHCDGVLRKDQNSQPDLSCIDVPIKHWLCTISGDSSGSRTQVVNDPVVLPVDDANVWSSVDTNVNYLINLGILRVDRIPNGQIIKINRATIHRAEPAGKRHWRFFFRLSYYHMPCANEVRNQVQVYTDINGGW